MTPYRNFSTTFMWSPDLFMFRLVGFGVWIARYSTFAPMFSERYGHKRAYRLGEDWRLMWLHPWK